ncbi:MAG: DegT/DnrJ/EryC1/StrS family aminotransferase [Dysgonamonadaceae bacterium]|jgi:dTDP-4-amino-4,6-dideoxygalactose transaminase|nr:DegT/DnrJ/EryC1/StrS family aminotransferase [Dysgonamonadaceae bacterium]
MDKRQFLKTSAILGVGLAATPSLSFCSTGTVAKPALLGGPKAHPGDFSGWPLQDSTEEKALMEVLNSGEWGRLGTAAATKGFEQGYAAMLGVPHVLGVTSGTSALYTILGALGIGPGDEVILPVYTFIATYNVVTLHYALPIIVDIDPESMQIDPVAMEKAITPQTAALLPVHIAGSPFDVDRVMEIGKKHNLPVVEDACQAHLAAWKGKKVGSFGIAGAFSFQASKNLNCGEGGAISCMDDNFFKSCRSFHHQGQGANTAAFSAPGEGIRGTNVRITEFQSAILNAQMTRLEAQAKLRSENAAYLSKMLNDIPGITPAKLYKGTTNSAYHLYMFKYDKTRFDGMELDKFIAAMNAEGVPCGTGYGQMNKDDYVTGLAKNKHYLKIYGEKTMNEWLERNHCPNNDKASSEEVVWMFQTMLLGSKTDMEQIAEAMRKIQKYAKELKNT